MSVFIIFCDVPISVVPCTVHAVFQGHIGVKIYILLHLLEELCFFSFWLCFLFNCLTLVISGSVTSFFCKSLCAVDHLESFRFFLGLSQFWNLWLLLFDLSTSQLFHFLDLFQSFSIHVHVWAKVLLLIRFLFISLRRSWTLSVWLVSPLFSRFSIITASRSGTRPGSSSLISIVPAISVASLITIIPIVPVTSVVSVTSVMSATWWPLVSISSIISVTFGPDWTAVTSSCLAMLPLWLFWRWAVLTLVRLFAAFVFLVLVFLILLVLFVLLVFLLWFAWAFFQLCNFLLDLL